MMEIELISAIFDKDVAKMVRLLKTGTNPNECEDNEGVTALHFLAQISSDGDALIMAKMLKKLGASLDVKTAEGLAPLDVAQLHENAPFVEWARSFEV